MKRLFGVVFFWILLIGSLSLVQGQGTNLLTNPGFEQPFQNASGTLVQVAQGWTPWHIGGGQSLSELVQPEYYPASDVTNGLGVPRIRSGNDAQQYHTYFATHDGGVYQRVTGVSNNAQLLFSVYIYVWSSSFDDVNISEGDGSVAVQVGIDPAGGTDASSASVVWSPASVQYDAYNQYTVSARASGTAVTVFVRSSVSVPVAYNNIYVDDAVLSVSSGAVATNTAVVVPTNTSGLPTQTPVPSITPTSSDLGIVATNTPVVLPTNTPTQTFTAAPTNTTVPSSTAVPTNTTVPSATAVPSSTAAPTSTPQATATATATNTLVVPPTQEQIVPTTTPVATATTSAPINAELPGRVIHTVRAGETVGKLATLYGSTIDAIIAANGLNESAFIRVGQSLVIPVRLTAPATSTPTVTPVAPAASATPQPPVTTVYVVRAGDTLNRIAARFNTTAATLAQLNGIANPNIIRVGQQITIPTGGGAPPVVVTSVSPATATPVAAARTHTVRAGETLFRIALRYGVSVSRIAQANGINDPNRVFVGQVLVIP
jgi:LysM repeat protein